MAGREEVLEDCRDHVRESFSFKVEFQLLSPAEYEKKREEWEDELCLDKKKLKFEGLDADNHPNTSSVDSHLLSFLLEMDEKLDRVIDHLTGKGKLEELLEEGIGLDLSGGGMKMRVRKSIEKGQILCANLLLCRTPFVRVRLFGEVTNSSPSLGEGTTCYDVGVRFIDLDWEERERIIACVFQRQREVLRKRRGKDGTDEEVTKGVE
jgi:hypothetical protein